MKRWIVSLMAAMISFPLSPLAASGADAARPRRIVFLGDSITDGSTLPLLVRQALVEAKKPVPVCINAGVASDTAALMRKRLGRDVLIHKPDLVLLSAGINDVSRKVKPEEFEAEVTGIAGRLKAANIEVILLTPSILGPKNAELEKNLEGFIAALRRVANKHGCKVAEVHARMKDARTAGKEGIEPDQIHLTFAGYQAMARAVLDALGHKDVAVPRELKIEVMPGIVREWKIRATGEKEPPLDEKSVQAVKPEDGKKYTLPETEPAKGWWFDQERQRGFAISLDRQIGPGKGYVGIAALESPAARKVYFNTGSDLRAVWLNGKRIYKNEAWTGWHAGKERIAAVLKEGRNVIIIESGPQFFLSITESNDW